MRLKTFQRQWLTSRGGRTEHDVFTKNNRRFVLMYTPHGTVREKEVFLPIAQELTGEGDKTRLIY